MTAPNPGTRLSMTPDQMKAVFTTGAELAVAAGAGSGKTRVLVERVINLVLGLDEEGRYDVNREIDLDRMLIVTFTKAAANEMRERLATGLAGELSRARHELKQADGDGRRSIGMRIARLRRQREALPRAQISTIHSFCEQVVSRFGEADGISLGRIMEESETRALIHRLATDFLDAELAGDGDSELRSLALAWGGFDGLGPEDSSNELTEPGLRPLITGLMEFRSSLVNPDAWLAQHIPVEPLPEDFDPAHSAVSQLLEPMLRERDEWLESIDGEAEGVRRVNPGSNHLSYLERRREVLRRLTNEKGWDWFVENLNEFSAKQDGTADRPKLPYKYKLTTSDNRDLKDWPDVQLAVKRGNETFKKCVADWQEALSMPWARVVRKENAVAAQLRTLWSLTSRFTELYAAYKQQHVLADFNDLERGALTVLTGTAGPVPDDQTGKLQYSNAALALREQFQAVLVDEYQDVNRLQDAIINLVTRDAPGDGTGRPRFVVGDIKQSIYGFRQAEPEIFAGLQGDLAAQEVGAGEADEVVRLRVNFRSRRGILSAVNQVFSGLMLKGFGGEDYVEDGSLDYGGLYPDERTGPVARLNIVSALAGDTDDDEAEPADSQGGSRDDQAFHRVAEIIWELRNGTAQSGPLQVYDRSQDQPRTVSWRDITVLLRSSRSRGHILRKTLEQAGIPVYAPGQSGFYGLPEVADLLSVLDIIDNPRQDVPLAAVLRGPLVGLSLDELLVVARQPGMNGRTPALYDRLLAIANGEGQAFGGMPDDDYHRLTEKLGGLLARLVRWREMARDMTISELVWYLYNTEGLLPAATALVNGEQRLMNLMEFHNRARVFSLREGGGISRFMAFVRASQDTASEGGEPAAIGENADVVRIMTIHKSKGLEFPVVIMPYLHTQFNLRSVVGDLLYDASSGIGGRYLDLSEHLDGENRDPSGKVEYPKVLPTIAYQGVRRELKRKLLAEELRMLYVGMTRARERLELVAALPEKDLTDVEAGKTKEPEDARCAWHWVGRQLQDEIRSTLKAGAAQAGSTQAVWDVTLSKALENEEEAEQARYRMAGIGRELDAVPDDEPGSVTGEAELNGIRDRLSFRYPWNGSSLLPAKLTVTGIAKTVAADEEETVDPFILRPARQHTNDPEAVVPVFMQDERPPTGAKTGTVIHRILAGLDLKTGAGPKDVQSVISMLKIPQDVSKSIDTGRILDAVAELHRQFDGFRDAEVSQELPVSMMVGAAEIPPGVLHSEQNGAYHADDWVLVQGVIDLVAAWPDRIVVVDFKTDRYADAAALHHKYRVQLEWYARAVRLLVRPPGDVPVRWALYALNGPGLIWDDDFC